MIIYILSPLHFDSALSFEPYINKKKIPGFANSKSVPCLKQNLSNLSS